MFLRARIYNNQNIQVEVQQRNKSNTEAVKCAARALEGIDDVEGSDRLSLCVLSVCHRVANDLAILVNKGS